MSACVRSRSVASFIQSLERFVSIMASSGERASIASSAQRTACLRHSVGFARHGDASSRGSIRPVFYAGQNSRSVRYQTVALYFARWSARLPLLLPCMDYGAGDEPCTAGGGGLLPPCFRLFQEPEGGSGMIASERHCP
jgi:hypothetical protein